MPQPLYPQPPDGVFSYRPRALISLRPGHAAGIGAVAAEWAALEECLTLAMVRSLLAFSEEGAYSIATTTLETIESPSTRLDVIAALLKIHAAKADFDFFANTLRPEIHKRAGERHRILQSIWYVDDRYPDHIIARLDGRYVKYNVHDITEVADRIVSTANSVREFVERF
jgi:hypothetical protein